MREKFEVFRGIDGQFYFVLKASNGKVVCQSEGYRRKFGALKGIASVKRFSQTAKIVEVD